MYAVSIWIQQPRITRTVNNKPCPMIATLPGGRRAFLRSEKMGIRPNFGIIYKVTNLINNKVYIGQTIKTLSQRKCDHAYRAKVNDKRTAFQIALLQHGVSAFQWDEIDTANSQDELDAKEKFWVAYFKTNDPMYGYNSTDGGIKTVYSPEIRRKMSDAKTGKKNPNFGKHLSDETRKKMSEIRKGKPKSDDHRRKISEANKGLKAGERHPNFGKHHSEETRKKIGEANRRRNI